MKLSAAIVGPALSLFAGSLPAEAQAWGPYIASACSRRDPPLSTLRTSMLFRQGAWRNSDTRKVTTCRSNTARQKAATTDFQPWPASLLDRRWI